MMSFTAVAVDGTNMISTAQAIERWTQAVRVLKNVPAKGFDWKNWGRHEGSHAPEEQNYCGTIACVGGWCGLDPWFQKHGLKAVWRQNKGIRGYVLDFNMHPSDFFNDKLCGEQLMYWSDPETGDNLPTNDRSVAIKTIQRHIKRLKAALKQEKKA
jgi:hypothetical protein